MGRGQNFPDEPIRILTEILLSRVSPRTDSDLTRNEKEKCRLSADEDLILFVILFFLARGFGIFSGMRSLS
jgi:hypothetical protein